MKANRRDFIRFLGLTGLGVLSTKIIPARTLNNNSSNNIFNSLSSAPQFNMSGYQAPKLDKVRIGFIGIGNRGEDAVRRMNYIEGVEIKAVCDIRRSAAEKVLGKISDKPRVYGDKADEWKKLCDSDDIDLVYICTPWDLHTPMAVYAMKAGKHVAIEVPAATTIEECWQLVETSEATKKHCTMLENCCYDFFELLTLNMVRQGVFGEIIHGEGAYIHNLINLNFSKDYYYDMWRLKENYNHNGNLYPTHGLGPICQIMNINRGDKMEYLNSTSTNDFIMGAEANRLASKDEFYQPFTSKKFRGNMNTSVIKTYKGKTIMIQHDVSSPRPYSRLHIVSGTKGYAQKFPDPGKISFGHDWISAEEMKKIEQQYTTEIITKVGKMSKKIGGHGGMDFVMDWRLIDCLRNGLALDQDVYDAALWSVITPLSEMSVKQRSNSVDIPDFTRGAWKTNTPIELTLKGGGTTNFRNES